LRHDKLLALQAIPLFARARELAPQLVLAHAAGTYCQLGGGL